MRQYKQSKSICVILCSHPEKKQQKSKKKKKMKFHFLIFFFRDLLLRLVLSAKSGDTLREMRPLARKEKEQGLLPEAVRKGRKGGEEGSV
jgi:hypothetical protein